MSEQVIVRPRFRSFLRQGVLVAAPVSATFLIRAWRDTSVVAGRGLLLSLVMFIAVTGTIGAIFFLFGRKRWVTISADGLRAPDGLAIQRDCTWDAILDAEALGEGRGHAVVVKVRHLPVMLQIPGELVDHPALLAAVERHVPWDHPLAAALRDAGA
jgi:hypothetical protein